MSNLSYEAREELGLLYSVGCQNCGWCWDDHYYGPHTFGHRVGDEPLDGFSLTIFACAGFVIPEGDVESVAYVSAKRQFWGGEPILEFLEDPAISERANAILLESKQEWEIEMEQYHREHQHDHIHGCSTVIIRTLSGTVIGIAE
jgi:hypothetical protein